MGFPSSWLEYHKWHERMQYRYNNAKARALQKKEALFNHLHGPSRPHASRPGVTKTGTGCYSPPSQRYDASPRHQMAKRDEKQEAATGDGAGVLLFTPPTLAKIHSSPTPDKEAE